MSLLPSHMMGKSNLSHPSSLSSVTSTPLPRLRLSAPTLLGSPSLLNGSCPKMPPQTSRPPCHPDQKTVLAATVSILQRAPSWVAYAIRPPHSSPDPASPQGLWSSLLCAPGLSPHRPRFHTKPPSSLLCAPGVSPWLHLPCQQALQCLPHMLKVFRGNNQLCS